ncbi:MAG: prepilin-type N-terminal cleavage/methylation domain-containing protein [Patescibacteria group bacterium]|nr:prepilin-type N-terminal cleavage/methylation domain-containing protein [Patescibacteria group bacterium]
MKRNSIIHSRGDWRKGQSLIEVLVALLIGTIMIGAGATIIAPVLRSNSQTLRAQVGASLAKELLDNVTVWGQGDWHNILNLSTTSANIYHFSTSTSPFSVVLGEESVQVETSTYTRYFYVDNVMRDVDGAVTEAGGANDPSTKKITVAYAWPQSATNTITTYLTRSHTSFIFRQSDWSGGGGQDSPVTSTNFSGFATSSSQIDFTSSTGSLFITF